MREKAVRLIDANIFIRDLTAMKSMYDAITLDGMIKALKEAPTIDPESLRPQWRDAKTDPPNKPGEYIVMIKGGASSTTLLYGGEKWFEELDDEAILYHVTHWMPLPEPPKEE